MTTDTRQSLRIQARNRRRNLSQKEHHQFSTDACLFAHKLIQDCGAKKIAAYLAHETELNCDLLINNAPDQGITCYLPCITQNDDLVFIAHQQNKPLETNAYGILQPCYETKNLIDPQDIDLIFMPLLAFDQNKNRLGSGKGYYDRALSHIRKKPPLLVGLAFSVQAVPLIPRAEWDIPLDHLITEKGLLF